MDILYPSEMKQQKVIKPSKKELLTDSENHLKKILIKSQLFLNTADALFKLDIPISILHASSHDYEDDDSKLILDCGYELMRRKGKRQEFAAHPCVNISLGFVKIKKFDELIQQLHKDFEKLKFYGRSGKQECDAGEYLPRMLQSDVYNSHPELSCMWDLGWNETMFAFIEVDEVVRDIEKDVLTGLVHEITRDLQFLPK